MHILKKIALGLLSPLFVFLLFATAFDIGFIRTATHPSTVKQLIAESGIYDSVVPNLLQQQKAISTPLGTISASDPAVSKAANQAVSPAYVKQNAETAIDNLYTWLDGQASQPSFSFNLAGQQSDFASSVAASLEQRLATLPACSSTQSRTIALSGSFDAVNATCLPRGVTAASAAQQLSNYLQTNSSFLNSATINSTDLKNGNGQTLFEQSGVKNIPKQYQRAKKTPTILIILTILTGIGIVLLSRNWALGLRHIGVSLLVIGLVMLAFSWALNRAVSTKIVPKIKVDNVVLQQDVRRLVQDVAQQIDKNYWTFGAVYSVLGAGALAGSYFALKKSTAAAPLNRVKVDLTSPPKKK